MDSEIDRRAPRTPDTLVPSALEPISIEVPFGLPRVPLADLFTTHIRSIDLFYQSTFIHPFPDGQTTATYHLLFQSLHIPPNHTAVQHHRFHTYLSETLRTRVWFINTTLRLPRWPRACRGKTVTVLTDAVIIFEIESLTSIPKYSGASSLI
ncbi:hypothetical protein EVAR_59453_1 [Eumeta japonica]|uniref:Uncharacterized protein n=1 Tax=Eumeta variegata TaxID=151549 RepID=A0A4C1ZZ10_EUMVA|nr:hypothetical protein EVAR_59453_1 [Eumeta japonica]